MNHFTFNRSQIELVYDEFARRIESEIAGDMQDVGRARSKAAYADTVRSMLQGIYGTLMVLSTNWPTVAQWIREIEEERHIYDNL